MPHNQNKKPLTQDELSVEAQKMMLESAREDREIRIACTAKQQSPTFFKGRPLSPDELSKRVQEMMVESTREDQEIRASYLSQNP